jgi:hypothetical protein
MLTVLMTDLLLLVGTFGKCQDLMLEVRIACGHFMAQVILCTCHLNLEVRAVRWNDE